MHKRPCCPEEWVDITGLCDLAVGPLIFFLGGVEGFFGCFSWGRGHISDVMPDFARRSAA